MDKPRALIGYTGFVGSAIDGSHFSDRFNSKNIEDMRGRHFSEVVCAGVQAVKWWANKNPEEDWSGIERLLDVLRTVTTDRFILISTVDVFQEPVGVDEATKIDEHGLHAYGLHRYRVEEFVRDQFEAAALILRLPGLFGANLKKNLIFDLLEMRDVSGFNPESAFQFYDITRLPADMAVISRASLPLVHLAVEPLLVDQIAKRITSSAQKFNTSAPRVRYDMQTMHAALWRLPGRYMGTAEDALSRIQSLALDWTQQ